MAPSATPDGGPMIPNASQVGIQAPVVSVPPTNTQLAFDYAQVARFYTTHSPHPATQPALPFPRETIEHSLPNSRETG